MNAIITLPADAISDLRSGLHSALGAATEAIDSVVTMRGREQHPEWYHEPLEHLDRVRALLDRIGWSDTQPATDIQLDVRTHRWALERALENAMKASNDALREAALVDRERAQRGEAPKRATTIERAVALHAFASTLETELGVGLSLV